MVGWLGSRRGRGSEHELFPGFTDVTEIGTGSLATVFRAREADTGRLVALKLLNLRELSPRAVESFGREALALGALGAHPHIVTLYRTFHTGDGRPVLVLELCTGAVSDRLQGGRGLAAAEAVAMGIKVAGALESAHRAGILHRDVKPQNLLVTEFGEPALADFGVALLHSAAGQAPALFDFTTVHAAPELLEGAETSAATDVYGLASTLYQLIAGQPAFRAFEGELAAAVILRILRDPVPPLVGLDVPVALSDLLAQAMAKDPARRPATAARFADALRAVADAQGWPRATFHVPRAERPKPTSLPASRPTPVFPPAGPPPVVSEPVPPPAVQPEPVPPPAVLPEPVPPRPTVPRRPLPPATSARAVPVRPKPLPRFPVAPAAGAPLTPAHLRPAGAAAAAARRAGGPSAASEPDVPVWSRRSEASTRLPAIDPRELEPTYTLRSGLSSITADEGQLTVRTVLRREHIAWPDISGFEAYVDDDGVHGFLIAQTLDGLVELPATRRPLEELRRVHALLEAYRLRESA